MPPPEPDRLLAAMQRLAPEATPWRGVLFRSTTPRYARSDDLTTGRGSALHGGRWNPPGLPAVYGSLDAETAMAETLAHVRYYGIAEHHAMPRVFIAIDAALAAVLDLRAGDLRQRLQVSQDRMLAEDWRKPRPGEEPLTQSLGRAAAAAGLEGLLVPSAPRPESANLVIYPANLRPGSTLRALGP